MITVKILIRGHCHEYFPHLPVEFEHSFNAGLTLRQIMEALGIKPQLIMGVSVNGKLQDKSYVPAEGDIILLISPPTGG